MYVELLSTVDSTCLVCMCFKLLFSGVSVCVLGFSWMPQCKAGVIQRKNFAWFEVNCDKSPIEISKKSSGKSLKSP